MRTLFLDTEYNGFGGELISMALVGEDEEWYEVFAIPEKPEAWVTQHVIPVLGREPIGVGPAKASLQRFLRRIGDDKIICDWYEDAVHFFQALAGDDYATSMRYGCDLRLLVGDTYAHSDIPHNALSDARALMKWWYS